MLGAYVSEKEIEAIVKHICKQRQPDYEFFDNAVRVICQMSKAQRQFCNIVYVLVMVGLLQLK